MSDHDIGMDYALALKIQRLFLQLDQLTVHHDGQVVYRLHYEEWLHARGIVIPAPPVLRPWSAIDEHPQGRTCWGVGATNNGNMRIMRRTGTIALRT